MKKHDSYAIYIAQYNAYVSDTELLFAAKYTATERRICLSLTFSYLFYFSFCSIEIRFEWNGFVYILRTYPQIPATQILRSKIY